MAYVLQSGGAPSSGGGAWAYVVAAGCGLVTLALTYGAAQRTRWWRIRRFLIEVARWDQDGKRHDAPDANELTQYGRLLGMDEGNETHSPDGLVRNAQRIWGVEHPRLPAAYDVVSPEEGANQPTDDGQLDE